jgi:Holliday junction resolvase YEN1
MRTYEVYRSDAIRAAWAKDDSALRTEEDCRMAMVFIALLAGGDYVPEGLEAFGA